MGAVHFIKSQFGANISPASYFIASVIKLHIAAATNQERSLRESSGLKVTMTQFRYMIGRYFIGSSCDGNEKCTHSDCVWSVTDTATRIFKPLDQKNFSHDKSLKTSTPLLTGNKIHNKSYITLK